jgi:predicted enzyme related to lactoylglutathione lyase
MKRLIRSNDAEGGAVTEKTSYAPGTPSWVDLGSPDVPASVGFYGELFGWDHAEAGDPEQTGGFGFFTKNGKRVAGIGPKQMADQPTVWTTYVTTADAEATAARVLESGGQVLTDPFEVMDAGLMAAFVDPTGAAIYVWEPKTHIGAELVNEPGAFSWSELYTRDPVAAKAFYSAIFGWEAKNQGMGEGGTYTQWMLGEDPIGGLIDMRGRLPDEVPPYWMTYFTVDGCDATVEKARDLGGNVAVGPRDLSIGRFAVLSDPDGANFAVFESTASPE